MLKILSYSNKETRSTKSLTPHSWVHAIAPNDGELSRLQEIGIPSELLVHVLDFDERSRVLKRGEVVHVVVHMPYNQKNESNIPYATAPVSVFLLPKFLVTIEPREMQLYEKLLTIPITGLTQFDKTRFILSLILQSASDYLMYLRDINLAVEVAEENLQRSLRNREVLELLNYQKSLVYFSTALNSIELMLEKLMKGDYIQWSSEDQELSEDALIEIHQAVYHVEIAQNILTQMMDAFASIVSNNLNTVMKFLAAVTIIISVPTLIASIYGMNVPLPGESMGQTFIYLLALSILISIAVIIVFLRKDWL